MPRFSAFLEQILLTPTVTIRFRGHAVPTVRLVIGDVSLSNITFEQRTVLQGLDSFAQPPITVVDVNVGVSTETSIILLVTLGLTNPSIFSVQLGPVHLPLLFNNSLATMAYVDDLVAYPGFNLVYAHGNVTIPDVSVDPARHDAVMQFLSQYMRGMPSNVTLRGMNESSSYPELQPAFSVFEANITFPGLVSPLVANATLYMDIGLSVPTAANGTLMINNSLNADVRLLNASLYVYICPNETAHGVCDSAPDYGDAIGYFYHGDLSLNPVVAPAHTLSRTKPYIIDMVGSIWDDLLILLQESEDHRANTKLNGTVVAQVGNFLCTVFYEQLNVDVFVAPTSDTPTNVPLQLPAPT
ncbi:DUF3712 domain-containing protein [archaeon]|nr:MAG: DUF3712 domain-containing protein [archaeon]